jgi:signal transduction histidine kinase
MDMNKKNIFWLSAIILLILIISFLHYTTPTSEWQYHLIYMQSYFIPILIAAFQFGIRGGLAAAIAVSIIYLPHIMLHWGGLVENNLMRFMQIILFNVIGFLTGLKAQRENEETLKYKKTAAELENSLSTVKQQSDTLVELEDQLRQSDRLAVVGELTSSLAHEVRNPLGSIRGAVEIIRDEQCPSGKRQEFLKILIEETERLNAVLENYLSFARNKKQPDSEYILQEIVANIEIMLGTQAEKKKIRIKPLLPDIPISLRGNPNDIWQILMNLTLNSMQAIRSGGTIEINLFKIDPDLKRPINTLFMNNFMTGIVLSVKDDGPGIPEKEQSNIFKPFHTTKATGSGLGLSIVKRIVDNNNWKIHLESREDSGTEIVILIPLNDKDE